MVYYDKSAWKFLGLWQPENLYFYTKEVVSMRWVNRS
jgi:hypothetical protein